MPASSSNNIATMFALACQRYAEIDVDVETALRTLRSISISLHCWQGDDVTGFENHDIELGGGLAVTGNYPGRARSAAELRQDIEQALRLIPGRHRLNLHASYGEFGGQSINRNAVRPEHFQGWIEWAKERGLGLDFNPTFFAHSKAASGLTLTHHDPPSTSWTRRVTERLGGRHYAYR